MIRLIINAIPLTYGGGAVGLIGLLDAWRELGVEMETTVVASIGRTIRLVRGRCDRIVEVQLPDSLFKRVLWQKWTLPKYIKKASSDVLMNTNMCIPRSPVPQLIHHRNLWTLFSNSMLGYLKYSPKIIAWGWEARKALRHADANVFISEYLRERAEIICPESEPRNHVIYNGLDSDVLTHARLGTSMWDGQPNICAVQSSEVHKGNRTLLHALARLIELCPDINWRLEIAGHGDWGYWRRLAGKLGVESRVHWLGYREREEIQTLYRRSFCLWSTSYFEGFGRCPIEAMAEGCPTIAVEATAVPEIVGKAGILVPPKDHEAFARQTIALWHDQRRRAGLVQAGHHRAQEFSWKDSARKMYTIFAQLADRGNRDRQA